MASPNIRDILTCFSPSMDFFAASSGDGRIKIWDIVKGQLQTEFTDILSADDTNVYAMSERGHLSVDYTCMKWLSFDRKKKRKLGALLVLGTGSGDILALDVSAGQLKWKISDCHPGGVSSVSFSAQIACVYSSGADGMVCEIDPVGGSVIRKFKASTKAISTMSVSPDGKTVATAAAQMKIFSCADHKKIQKFSGHPGIIRCIVFMEDGKHVLSSAVGERYIAVWEINGSKKQSASCILAMEHPAVYLDSRFVDDGGEDGAGIYVLAISEVGRCYFWYGKDIEELRNSKPSKISLSLTDDALKRQKGGVPAIFAARMQKIVKPASAYALVVHGSLIRPSFETIALHHGKDLKLNVSQEGLLIPFSQSRKSKKRSSKQSGATVLDRADAEDALLPIPKVLDFHDRTKQDLPAKVGPYHTESMEIDDVWEIAVAETTTHHIEDQLRSLGILGDQDGINTKSSLDSSIYKGIDLEANIPEKKMRAAISSLTSSEAYDLLSILVGKWQLRSCSEKTVLPWIQSILVNHKHNIISEDDKNAKLDSLYRISKYRGSNAQCLMKLSGRLQLLRAQIDKGADPKSQILPQDGEKSGSEDGDVDEVVFRGDESDISSDPDDAVDD